MDEQQLAFEAAMRLLMTDRQGDGTPYSPKYYVDFGLEFAREFTSKCENKPSLRIV